jgi:predicted RNase H-like HicB family nuclease
MSATRRLTAFITREGDGYASLCPELDIASQGANVEQARANLTEALELFFECASPAEVEERLSRETYISSIELPLSA